MPHQRAEPQRAAGWGEIQSVVEQVAQGLAQQERFAKYPHIGGDGLLDVQAGAFDPRTLSLQHILNQGCQRNARLLFQTLALFHLGQVQQALDQLLQARTFAVDIADKPLLLLTAHVALQQLRRTPNRRQRALQFMGQRMHVALYVSLAFQLRAHVFHGAG